MGSHFSIGLCHALQSIQSLLTAIGASERVSDLFIGCTKHAILHSQHKRTPLYPDFALLTEPIPWVAYVAALFEVKTKTKHWTDKELAQVR